MAMDREEVLKELRAVRGRIACNEAYMERLRRDARILVEMLDRTDRTGEAFTEADELTVIKLYWG